LRLPYAVDPDQVKATFQDGILTLTLPKGKEQERSRRIQVSTGAGQTAPKQGGKSEKQSAGGKGEAIS
jgi:HSP20 family protein